MMNIKRALVVGCGIGGATAAYTLRRIGLDVDCIDVKPATPTTGSGICLLHNALRALSSIDLAQPCMESGLRFSVFRQFDSTGRHLMSNDAPPGFGIRRPELARILESAARDAGANLHTGCSVASVQDRGDKVDVEFSDGSKGSYDLVVIADGAYSKLRRQFFGEEHDAKFTGQSGWRFNAPRPAEVDGFCLFRSADGRRVVGALPTSKEACYLFFLENSAEHLKYPSEQLHVLMREKLAEFTAPVIQDALKHVERADQVLFRPFDITLVPPPWHRGRLVLLGDAAHAPTPQMTSGGGMAIEDAVVLAQCLDAASSLPEGLDKYVERRYERVKTVWEASRQLCTYEQDPVPNPPRSAALLLKTYQYLGEPM